MLSLNGFAYLIYSQKINFGKLLCYISYVRLINESNILINKSKYND